MRGKDEPLLVGTCLESLVLPACGRQGSGEEEHKKNITFPGSSARCLPCSNAVQGLRADTVGRELQRS